MAFDSVNNGTEDHILRQDGSHLEVGDRVSVEGHIGTVKYIGLVPPTKDKWLGVDWDDQTRGKHNGAHQNRQYFVTRHPTSGSFIRPSKVDSGITIVKALQDRYGLKEVSGGVDSDALFVLDEQFNQTVVEMVGAEKVNQLQSTFNKLKKVCFYDMCVYGSGPADDFGKLCPSITYLDLSHNLLSSWERVAQIAAQLPQLRDLNVSENQLRVPKDLQTVVSGFSRIRGLTINKMGLIWEEVVNICCMFPALQEINACTNNISQLSDSREVLKNLKTLNLYTNKVESWDEFLKLGNLPNLETIFLNENKIKSVYLPDCNLMEKSKLFPQVKVLFLKENEISEWSSIDELNKLQNLEELEITGCPIMKTYSLGTVRQMRIAKLENIKIIARSVVTYDERKGAEIDYLKRFGAEWKQEGGHPDNSKNQPSQEFQKKHPRFQKLIDKWGAPEDSELEEKPKTLKDQLININVSSAAHIAQKGVVSKKLPGTISIQKLKTLVQRMFRMDCEPMLSYTSHKKEDAPQIDLDNDMRQLCFYSIESGDTLHVKWD